MPNMPISYGRQSIAAPSCNRASQIASDLLGDRTFTCHDDIDKPESRRQHCAGALIILDKLEQPNQMMRIMGRLGDYRPEELTGHDEVFDDFNEWIEAQCD